MKLFNPFLLLLALLFVACQKQDAPLLPLPNELPTSEATQAFFNLAWENNQIIVAIDSINIGGIPYCRFTFENGQEALIKKELTAGLETDSSNWSAKLTLQDGAQLPAYILGDTIYVDSITVDPFGTAPLSARLAASMPVKGRFGVVVQGRGEDGIPIGHAFEPYTNEHKIPVLGLYPEYENEVDLAFLGPEGQVRATRNLRIRTGGVPGRLTVNIFRDELPPGDAGIFFVSDVERGFDHRGELRWAYTGDGRHLYQKLANGNFVVSDIAGGVSYHSATFSEITMLGEMVQQYDVPNLMHHEIRELPNGNFLVATNSAPFANNRWDGELEEDVIIEVDRATGEIIRRWNLNLILDNQRPRADGSNNDDWLHLNAIYFDEADNSLVFSGRHQSLVAKIGYEEGDLRWILAHPAGWGPEHLPFVLTPVLADGTEVELGTQDFLPYFPHYPEKLPNGNILVFDNGNYRGFYDDPEAEEASYSRAVEYEVDPQAGTVRKVWEFSYDKSIFTEATGSAQYLEKNGHRLVGFMNGTAKTPKIVELDESDHIVFEANVNLWSDYYRCEKYGLYDRP
ncbi:MAG: aryl-sulfate sulfotransferase [Phaeodactylibacter sp.]|nr:aryl-sulfate sulfotransferase [Phaeodactylibacter sp.]MCB9298069.1 aryl-sulfate sulfotransferase [Lewinellaceae bacterium]